MNSIKDLCLMPGASLKQVLQVIENASNKGLPTGIVLITNAKGNLIGVLTEGDIRRALLESQNFDILVEDAMQKDPIAFSQDLSILEILEQIPHELSKRGRRSKKFLNKIILVDKNNCPVRILDYHQLWEQRVATHRHMVIIGLGYVGLTLALALAEAGFMVTGVDNDHDKVDSLKKNKSYIHEIGLAELLRENLNKNFFPSDTIPEDGDVFIISVGTPVEKRSSGDSPLPNLNYLDSAIDSIIPNLKNGNLIVLRSTVPVGTCRDYVIPRLENGTGMQCGLDFHLSFAPERTAEGKAIKELRELPQIIGGYNQDSVEATVALFRDLTPTIIRVESLEVAEMAKLLNNTYRDFTFFLLQLCYSNCRQVQYRYYGSHKSC